jgi:methyltransferase (TIGR00027 family)
MKIPNSSATAYLIAESAVYLSANPTVAHLLPGAMVELSRYFADSRPFFDKLGYLAKRNRLFRPFFNALENLIIPGIQLHYLVRKRRIEEIAREAIARGVEQIVVLGAGFDTLALRLHREFPDTRFIEIDRPATQQAKRGVVNRGKVPDENLKFVPCDLSSGSFAAHLAANSLFNRELKTLFVAEGLLMYLTERQVTGVFDFIRENSAGGSLFAFTFMERQPGGRIAFRNSSRLVDHWLAMHGEPFRWGLARGELRGFLRDRGFVFVSLDDTAAFREKYLSENGLQSLRLASGESLCLASVPETAGVLVNDVHSKLNETRVSGIVRPESIEEVRQVIDRARGERRHICVAGGFHSMGGQQFLTGGILIDMSAMDRVLNFDPENLIVEVESGILWSDLIPWMVEAQKDAQTGAGIRQKQTGADRLSVGGALSSNIHGRGLAMKPIVDDVESFRIACADGTVRRCSRDENYELFRLAIGGYGLFGIIVSAELRLARREKVSRHVEIGSADNLPQLFADRIVNGFKYGDFQFAIDPANADFIRKGVFSCYRPVPDNTPVPTAQKELSPLDWQNLLLLAHTDRHRAFGLYSSHYLTTHGQVYWSDTHQLSTYLDDYHTWLDEKMESPVRCSEMITEVYVPLDLLPEFLEKARADFRANNVNLIYGTIRLIRRDDESFLAWAREDFACIVFNLHVEHSAEGIDKAKTDFRRLIDLSIEFGGSFYLTYHRWASREQVLACYPQMPKFLEMKKKYDANEVFQSDWYRHFERLFRIDRK